MSNNYVIIYKQTHPLLDEYISIQDLQLSLKKSKANKAPGDDMVNYSFFKYLPENWLCYLQHLYNRIMETERVPSSWGKLTTLMFHKKGDMTNPDNYRPITLINNIAKIFTQILADRLNTWCDSRGAIPEI